MTEQLGCYIIQLGKLEYSVEVDDDFETLNITVDGSRFMLSHNKQLDWYRLLINYADGSWKDLPFNERTWCFLPEGISVKVRE